MAPVGWLAGAAPCGQPSWRLEKNGLRREVPDGKLRVAALVDGTIGRVRWVAPYERPELERDHLREMASETGGALMARAKAPSVTDEASSGRRHQGKKERK